MQVEKIELSFFDIFFFFVSFPNFNFDNWLQMNFLKREGKVNMFKRESIIIATTQKINTSLLSLLDFLFELFLKLKKLLLIVLNTVIVHFATSEATLFLKLGLKF